MPVILTADEERDVRLCALLSEANYGWLALTPRHYPSFIALAMLLKAARLATLGEEQQDPKLQIGSSQIRYRLRGARNNKQGCRVCYKHAIIHLDWYLYWIDDRRAYSRALGWRHVLLFGSAAQWCR